MTRLSPAAQAVWDAYNDVCERVGVFEDYGDALAAALRTAADQTMRPDPLMGIDCIIYAKDIIAIAAELEADR